MRLVMMGTGLFAEPTFEALLRRPNAVAGLVTQPDRAVGQQRGSTRQTGRGMKDLAQEHRVPVLQPESINSPEGIAGLREFSPDLLVVAAYGQILSREVLTVPPLGGINVHASLLPKYRGAAPIAWAIANGETTTGVSIIKMSVSLDAGDVLAQEATPLGPDETTGDVEARLAAIGARLALQVIDEMAAGTVRGCKQDPGGVTRAPKLTKEHGVLDWMRSAQTVVNHVRAMQPWPTAYTHWHRAGSAPLRVIVCRAAAIGPGPERSANDPGTILPGEKQRLLVVAGDGTVVEILELQPAGKRRMTAGEFLRGHPVEPGDRLGP
jgi:methionyl-tRNA formyltransferase